METKEGVKTFYLYPGSMFAQSGNHTVTTVLGSCISVCLWDGVLRIGGINHYMLALWNGEGLPTPKYGNIAILKLIEKMLDLGSKKDSLCAKVFGGSQMLKASNDVLQVGCRNILLAEEILRKERIPIVSRDIGGVLGRKVIFNTESGSVWLKKINKTLTGQISSD